MLQERCQLYQMKDGEALRGAGQACEQGDEQKRGEGFTCHSHIGCVGYFGTKLLKKAGIGKYVT